MAVVQNTASRQDRCLIDPFDSNHLVTVGSGSCYYSMNEGVTWNTSSLPDSTNVRNLLSPESGVLYAVTNSRLCKSINGGATWSHIPVDADANRKRDICFYSDQIGWLIEDDLANTGSILKLTMNGGATWVSRDLHSLSGWIAGEELALRIVLREYNVGGVIQIYLLTSHAVHLLTHIPNNLYGLSISPHWSFISVVEPLITPNQLNGYVGGVPYSAYFDDIHFAFSRLWLGGYNGLNARSLDLASFVVTDPSLAHLISLDQWYSMTRSFNMNDVVISASEYGTAIPPFISGYKRSLDAGDTLSSLQNIEAKEASRGVSVYGEDEVLMGCTTSNACNYDSNAEVDSGECVWKTTLTPCNGTDYPAFVTSDYEVFMLRCRKPVFRFFLGSVTGLNTLSVFINLTLSGGGNYNFQFSHVVTPGLSAAEQYMAFIGSFVEYVNSNTPLRAWIIPDANNPFQPGFQGAVAIEASSISYAGIAATIAPFGFNGSQADTGFDNGSTGNTLRFIEFPDGCFTACDPANCSLPSIPVTLISSHSSCDSCSSLSDSQHVCFDCGRQLYINGMAVSPNDATGPLCIIHGSTLDFNVNINFPEYVPTDIEPIEVGSTFVIGQQVTLHFTEDLTSVFFPGQTILLNTSSSAQYLVESVEYDTDLSQTVLVLGGVYLGSGNLVSVTVYSDCTSSVHISVEKLVSDGTFSLVFEQTTPAVDGSAVYLGSYLLTDYANYRVAISSIDCSGTRTCVYHTKVCDDFVVQQTDCHEYQIGFVRQEGSFPAESEFHFVLTDLSNSSVVVDSILVEADFPVKIIGHADTVYLVSVTLPDGTVMETKIIDLCDLLKCRASLIPKLLCTDLCSEDKMTKDQLLIESELLRITTVYGEIQRQVHDIRYRSLGLPLITGTEKVDLSTLANTIAFSRTVSARCANCLDSKNCEEC